MEFKREKIIAFWLAAGFLVVGVICYAAFPDKKPEEPVRIMFQSTAGKVLFTHKIHTSGDWYGFDCVECHHELEDDPDAVPQACGECHFEDSKEEPTLTDAFHEQCTGCHEDVGTAPVDCATCHIL